MVSDRLAAHASLGGLEDFLVYDLPLSLLWLVTGGNWDGNRPSQLLTPISCQEAMNPQDINRQT